MTTSVNTGYGSTASLQNLAETTRELHERQSRIGPGPPGAGADGARGSDSVYRSMREDVQALGAVTRSLDRTLGVVDTAIAAGTSLSGLLQEMRDKALAARDTAVNGAVRSAINSDFVNLRDRISTTLSAAGFDGSSLVNADASDLMAQAGTDGKSFITVQARLMELGGGIVTLQPDAVITTPALASAALRTIDASLNNLKQALSQFADDARKVSQHKAVVGKVSDGIDRGMGKLVDADLASERAALQALQTRQQLGVHVLSIANQTPQAILNLFR